MLRNQKYSKILMFEKVDN